MRSSDASRPSASQTKPTLAARTTAALLLLLGFGFTASALFGEPQRAPAIDGDGARAQLVVPAANVAPDVESPEVAAAVRHWAWETPATERRKPGHYDYEELWLSR